MKINENGIVRDMTPDEIAEYELRVSNATPEVSRVELIEAEIAVKESGYQKLIALGLTEAEATALTGYVPQQV